MARRLRFSANGKDDPTGMDQGWYDRVKRVAQHDAEALAEIMRANPEPKPEPVMLEPALGMLGLTPEKQPQIRKAYAETVNGERDLFSLALACTEAGMDRQATGWLVGQAARANKGRLSKAKSPVGTRAIHGGRPMIKVSENPSRWVRDTKAAHAKIKEKPGDKKQKAPEEAPKVDVQRKVREMKAKATAKKYGIRMKAGPLSDEELAAVEDRVKKYEERKDQAALTARHVRFRNLQVRARKAGMRVEGRFNPLTSDKSLDELEAHVAAFEAATDAQSTAPDALQPAPGDSPAAPAAPPETTNAPEPDAEPEPEAKPAAGGDGGDGGGPQDPDDFEDIEQGLSEANDALEELANSDAVKDDPALAELVDKQKKTGTKYVQRNPSAVAVLEHRRRTRALLVLGGATAGAVIGGLSGTGVAGGALTGGAYGQASKFTVGIEAAERDAKDKTLARRNQKKGSKKVVDEKGEAVKEDKVKKSLAKNEYGHRYGLEPGDRLEIKDAHGGGEVIVLPDGQFKVGSETFSKAMDLLDHIHGNDRHKTSIRRYFRLGE